MKKKKKSTVRVTIDFPVEEHRQLKALVAKEGTSMQSFILNCVTAAVHRKSKAS